MKESIINEMIRCLEKNTFGICTAYHVVTGDLLNIETYVEFRNFCLNRGLIEYREIAKNYPYWLNITDSERRIKILETYKKHLYENDTKRFD